MSARETAELLLQVGRLVQAEGYDGELSPAQWMALRFFARANPFSRTPSAFAEFQATTRGTATQAIKGALINNLVTFRYASCWELWCSSIPHESHEETCSRWRVAHRRL